MNYTTIEQSKKLAEILPIESSDMYWDLLSKDKYAKVNNIGQCLCRTCVYAWSLAALLELLRSYNDCNNLTIFSNRSQKWQITISYYDAVWKEHEEVNMDLFEAAYNTVVWLSEHGYFKTEKL